MSEGENRVALETGGGPLGLARFRPVARAKLAACPPSAVAFPTPPQSLLATLVQTPTGASGLLDRGEWGTFTGVQWRGPVDLPYLGARTSAADIPSPPEARG